MIFLEYEKLLSLRNAMLDRLNEEIQNTSFESANAQLEEMDKRIEEKRKELRSSKHTYDKVYRMRFLDCLRVEKIAMALNYETSSVYRILRKIGKEIKVAKKYH